MKQLYRSYRDKGVAVLLIDVKEDYHIQATNCLFPRAPDLELPVVVS